MPWTGIVFVLGGLGLAGMVPFGTFLGEHAIDFWAERFGLWWLEIIFFVAGALTAGAVFRVYARVFLGRGTRLSPHGGKLVHEAHETKGPHNRVPAVMFLPALVLVLIAIASGCIPQAVEALRISAHEFTDGAGYQARVLAGAYLPMPYVSPNHAPLTSAFLRSIGTTIVAIALAAFAISPMWNERRFRARSLVKAMSFVRHLHSGKIGDYVAYFTFGVPRSASR
jgi:multicomponent Na+:H+ antiporter subunit D